MVQNYVGVLPWCPQVVCNAHSQVHGEKVVEGRSTTLQSHDRGSEMTGSYHTKVLHDYRSTESGNERLSVELVQCERLCSLILCIHIVGTFIFDGHLSDQQQQKSFAKGPCAILSFLRGSAAQLISPVTKLGTITRQSKVKTRPSFNGTVMSAGANGVPVHVYAYV